jgi:hypothetical protein
LYWEAIKHAASVSELIDFEGSMMAPIERINRSFGAKQIPYFQITKINSLKTRVSQDLRAWWAMVRKRS